MNNRAVTLSLVMAIIAVFFVQSYVSSIEEGARKKFGTTVMVVSARTDIGEMATINETMLELKPIPKEFLEPSAISFLKSEGEEAASKDMKRLAGMVALVPIKAGEQISYNKVTEPSLRTGLAPQVTPGRRAFAVPVNETSAVGKLLKPGDRVDVIAVIDMGGKDKIVKTMLQDTVVLAVGRYVTNNVARLIEVDETSKKPRVRPLTEFDGFSSVTLELEPVDVQAISLIMATGNSRLLLSLRNNDDTDRVAVEGMSILDVLGADRTRSPAGAARK